MLFRCCSPCAAPRIAPSRATLACVDRLPPPSSPRLPTTQPPSVLAFVQSMPAPTTIERQRHGDCTPRVEPAGGRPVGDCTPRVEPAGGRPVPS
eukprot:6829862-Prymnesium_polylepis.2